MHRDAIASHLQYNIGLTYRRQGNGDKALKTFGELYQKNKEEGITDPILLRHVLSIYENQGRDQSALDVSMEILQIAGDDKETLVKVVHLLKKRGDTNKLVDYLRRLHKLYPNNNNFTMEYANALMEKNEIPKAIELYKQIAEKYDLSDENYNEDAQYASLKLAECMLKSGTLDQKKIAYKLFLELTKDDKKFKEAWAGLAKAATEL